MYMYLYITGMPFSRVPGGRHLSSGGVPGCKNMSQDVGFPWLCWKHVFFLIETLKRCTLRYYQIAKVVFSCGTSVKNASWLRFSVCSDFGVLPTQKTMSYHLPTPNLGFPHGDPLTFLLLP